MAENKTQATGASVEEFLAAVEHPVRRGDGLRLLALMSEITGEPGGNVGPDIVGFGRYHYKYASGREGMPPAVGFSPRKSSLSLYGLTYGPEAADLLGRLGKHKLGAGCLYVTKLDDVDEAVLAELIRLGYRHVTTALHHGWGSRPVTIAGSLTAHYAAPVRNDPAKAEGSRLRSLKGVRRRGPSSRSGLMPVRPG